MRQAIKELTFDLIDPFTYYLRFAGMLSFHASTRARLRLL